MFTTGMVCSAVEVEKHTDVAKLWRWGRQCQALARSGLFFVDTPRVEHVGPRITRRLQ